MPPRKVKEDKVGIKRNGSGTIIDGYDRNWKDDLIHGT